MEISALGENSDRRKDLYRNQFYIRRRQMGDEKGRNLTRKKEKMCEGEGVGKSIKMLRFFPC